MRDSYEDLDTALEKRRRMRARRRRLLYLRRTLLILAMAAIAALIIATPIWIIHAVIDHRATESVEDSAPTAPPTTTTTTAPPPRFPAVDSETISLDGKVDGTYAVLLDMTDGCVVAAKNANTPANPASITKVMTLLVAVENIEDLYDEYTMS